VAAAGIVITLAVGCKGAHEGPASQSTGSQLYAANCSTCHGPSGKGIGDFPTIVGVADILGGDYARTVITEGRNLMPSFRATLTPAQIDEIVDYMATFD
jgi:quinoprotein glucose dehydrogenase